MSEIGTAISSSFAFVSQVGNECEALANLIKQEISDLLSKSPLSGLYKPGAWSSSYKTDTNAWIYQGAAWSLPLVPKGKRNVTAHLSFQLSLLCDNAEGGLSPEPLLHVNFWDEPTNFNDQYMGFEMYDISPKALTRLREGTARLFRWESDNGAADRWTYSLRLADINGLDDVRRLIRSPVEQLVINVDAGEATLDQLASAVCYTAVEEMPDYYRVVR